jgi:hypothetical protein
MTSKYVCLVLMAVATKANCGQNLRDQRSHHVSLDTVGKPLLLAEARSTASPKTLAFLFEKNEKKPTKSFVSLIIVMWPLLLLLLCVVPFIFMKFDSHSREFHFRWKSEAGPAMALPVVPTEKGWCIRGCQEHQGLKMGLRQLSTRPHILHEDASIKKAHSIKQKLMTGLCEGEVTLSQVHPNDLSAAQGDVKGLAVAQLLNLSVKYDSKATGAQGEFMRVVENVLFEKLGQCAIKKSKAGCNLGDSAAVRLLGREAVLLVAAGAAITVSPVWNWWTPKGRVFFNVDSFSCVEDFPKSGVLEFSDYSKNDRVCGNNLDWQVRHVTDKSKLLSAEENERRKPQACGMSSSDLTKSISSLKRVPGTERND